MDIFLDSSNLALSYYSVIFILFRFDFEVKSNYIAIFVNKFLKKSDATLHMPNNNTKDFHFVKGQDAFLFYYNMNYYY